MNSTTTGTVKIMAVDDDPEVLGTLGRVLEYEGFETRLADSGMKALTIIEDYDPDLVILDIIMPGMDGIAVCRQLRGDVRFTSLPILFLTAKGSTDDIVEGLDSGADDYIVKPFELAELRARVHALLRRGQRGERSSSAKPEVRVKDLRLDTDMYRAYVGDDSIVLTTTEYRLLRYMMENCDTALSLSDLLQSVWDYPPNTGDPDLVRAHVRNLRKKLDDEDNQRYIRTVHGIGYMISS
jgi:DNA-binding response OmpR family regulator